MTEERHRVKTFRRPGGPRGNGGADKVYELIERFDDDETSYFHKTYTCRERNSGRQYLLRKVILDKLSQEDADRRREELKLWPNLRHRNILQFVDGWQSGRKGQKRIFFISTFAKWSLQKLLEIKIRSPPEDLYVKWLYQIASALQYLHEDHNAPYPILHRNLKPENILVTDGLILQLSDFASSRILDGPREMTRSRIGSARFMSPEMVQGTLYDSKTDIWSFGITAVYVATLQHAVQARTFDTLFRRTRNGEVSGVGGSYSQNVRNLVDEMLRAHPQQRPSAREVISKLSLLFRDCSKDPDPESYGDNDHDREHYRERNPELTVETLSLTLVVHVTVTTAVAEVFRPGISVNVHIESVGVPRQNSPDLPSPRQQTTPSTQQETQPSNERFPDEDNSKPEVPGHLALRSPDEDNSSRSSPPFLLNTFPGAFGKNRLYSGPLQPLERNPSAKKVDSTKKKKKKSLRRETSDPAVDTEMSGSQDTSARRVGETREPRGTRCLSEADLGAVASSASHPRPALSDEVPPERWPPRMFEYWRIARDLLPKMEHEDFWLAVRYIRLFGSDEVQLWLEERNVEGAEDCVRQLQRLMILDEQLDQDLLADVKGRLHAEHHHHSPPDPDTDTDTTSTGGTCNPTSSGLGESWASSDFEF